MPAIATGRLFHDSGKSQIPQAGFDAAVNVFLLTYELQHVLSPSGL